MKENGLLLVNLGSPQEPTVPAVKHYLNEFLGDPNVITMPPALWQPILKGMILPFRSKSSAATYQHCWMPDGSPLIVNTANLTKRVQEYLPSWDVRMAMTYEHPAIDETLRTMKKECRHITVLSLFPHFTQSTTQSIIEQVQAVDPAIRVIDRFADEPDYLQTLATHVQEVWEQGEYDRLVIAYHGIPVSMVKHGDPYQEETERTTAKLRQLLAIDDDRIIMTYQSKFGPMPWLQPYLKDEILEEIKRGHKKLLVVVPSFVTDCLETIEEDQVENHQRFLDHGGKVFDVVPALNDRPEFAQFLAHFVQQQVELPEGGALR
ncbi:ferrochelatase [Limosilactobacillus kribbianus]|uniref:ferrochelatase n=1 Tax=Limosilactobacillus kribbianus TaxID=2982695 RepID=UPI002264DE3F|nr:ferrochelatase [Limosilactobacillus kribbianus]